jgi:hypothetical protein
VRWELNLLGSLKLTDIEKVGETNRKVIRGIANDLEEIMAAIEPEFGSEGVLPHLVMTSRTARWLKERLRS